MGLGAKPKLVALLSTEAHKLCLLEKVNTPSIFPNPMRATFIRYVPWKERKSYHTIPMIP